ncbi:uncharacterized protein LOC117291266 [Asterias rubens]|uniref:uncharacterized protein LOC117291266 n=1 Tax=Asterias rubens TaxID=7604 RepID=UPI001454E7BC|nr:uncharacterized protein LOC117291266 [Asterias rubens]
MLKADPLPPILTISSQKSALPFKEQNHTPRNHTSLQPEHTEPQPTSLYYDDHHAVQRRHTTRLRTNFISLQPDYKSLQPDHTVLQPYQSSLKTDHTPRPHDHTHTDSTHSNFDTVDSKRTMNRPVFHTSRGNVLMKSNIRPEDDIAALSTELSTRIPLVQETSIKDFERSRTIYTTNATLVDRKKRYDVTAEKKDNHIKRQSTRRKKDNVTSMQRGGTHYFPPGNVIPRNDSLIPSMFPKVRRVDRGGACPTQLYKESKLSYTDKINGSVQLDHYVRRNSRPRMEPLRVPSTSTGTSAGEESLESVISSNKMTIEGRVSERQTRDLPPVWGFSHTPKYDYFDEGLSVPPNSEYGPSRLQMVTPFE